MKARLAAFLTGWFALSLPLLAFEGRVLRQNGRPVAGATVSILGQPGTVRTDQQGRFKWEPDPSPPFHVLVILQGGRNVTLAIETLPPEGIELLIPPAGASEEVTVTAEAAPHIESPPANANDLLAEEDLLRRHPPRLTDAIENIPGAGRLGQSHDEVPSIRGLARGRTLILIDGARVTSERRAGPSASYLDPFFLDAVEVSRGPGSVAYGSDAFGGVIHALTPSATPGDSSRWRMTASGGVGIPQYGAGAEYSRGLDRGGIIFQGRYRTFGDYDSPEGEVPNSSSTDYGWFGRIDHEAGPGVLSVGLHSDQSRDVERPTSPTSSITTRPREESYRLTSSYKWDPFADATLVGLSAYGDYNRTVTQRTSPGSLSSADVKANDVGFRASVMHPLTSSRVEVGMDAYSRFNLEAESVIDSVVEQAIEDARSIDTGVYVTGDLKLNRFVEIDGGLRYDVVTTANKGGTFGDQTTRNGSFSGFASVIYEPVGGMSLTGQVASGFREPSLSDRYYDGVSGRGIATGNPALEPETSLQYDLAFRMTRGRFRGAIYLYHYDIENLVERYEPIPDEFAFRNRGEATLRGLEIELRGDLGHGFMLGAVAQTARGEDEDGNNLADIPVTRLTVSLRKAFSRGYVEMHASAYGEDDNPGPTEVRTPGFVTVDLGAGWRAAENLELRLVLDNLLDQTYPASPDVRAPLAPGRSVVLTLVSSIRG